MIMPNRNYEKGRRKEYKIVHMEREAGRIAFRSAGSHSFADVVSVDIIRKKIRFIQCKPDDMNSVKKQKIRDENHLINGIYEVTFSVV